MDRYPLRIVSKSGEDLGPRHYLGTNAGVVMVRLQLPPSVTCAQCVLQWTYNAGNSWGCDLDDPSNCCVGCGAQENFVNCADVAIEASGDVLPTPADNDDDNDTSAVTQAAPVVTETSVRTEAASTTAASPGCPCRPAGVWAAVPSMDNWCCFNCQSGQNHPATCPASHCSC